MLLMNWLVVLRDRLWNSRRQTNKRRRRTTPTGVPALIEMLEPRQVMSAVAVVDDSYTVAQQQMMMAAPPVVMDVLANDTSTGGQLSIVSVSTPTSGSVSIQHDSMSAMYGMTPQPDKLLFTPAYGFTGTESFTYTVANAAGDQATATVTLTVSPASGSSGSGSGGYGMTMPTPPNVMGLSVNEGTTGGGTSVTISGSGFSTATQVLFGGAVVSSFTVNSDSSLTAVTPMHLQGMVDVIVVSPTGASSITMSDKFTFRDSNSSPTVSSVTPGTATISGGDTITITGTGFNDVSGVSFGGVAASSFTVMSPTTILAVTPFHMSGQVDVQVSTLAGTSQINAADTLIFTTPVSPPLIMSLMNNSGSVTGGTSVTIMGANFTNVTAVWFGDQQATSFTVNSANSITAVTPAALAGVVDVKATNSAGTSPSMGNQFTYISAGPSISGLSTNSSPVGGGSTVTIYGSNFQGVTAVYFGSVAANFVVNGPNSISATAPAQSRGTVDITVVSPDGTSAVSLADKFSYVAPAPSVTGLSVSTGSTSGGTAVTISGTNLSGATSVTFGGVSSSFTVNSDGTLTAITPASTAQTVDVVVTTADGTSQATMADLFTFQANNNGGSGGSGGMGGTGGGNGGTTGGSNSTDAGDPQVVLMTTVADSTSGGKEFFIQGLHLTDVTSVMFGDVAASSFTVNSDTSITVDAPPHVSGTVDVLLVTPAGASAAINADRFQYVAPGEPPVITEVASSTTMPSNLIMITGQNFLDVSAVTIGGKNTAFIVVSPTTITASTPMGLTGSADVVVTNAVSSSQSTPASQTVLLPAVPGGAAGGVYLSADDNFSYGVLPATNLLYNSYVSNVYSYVYFPIPEIPSVSTPHPVYTTDGTVSTMSDSVTVAPIYHFESSTVNGVTMINMNVQDSNYEIRTTSSPGNSTVYVRTHIHRYEVVATIGAGGTGSMSTLDWTRDSVSTNSTVSEYSDTGYNSVSKSNSSWVTHAVTTNSRSGSGSDGRNVGIQQVNDDTMSQDQWGVTTNGQSTAGFHYEAFGNKAYERQWSQDDTAMPGGGDLKGSDFYTVKTGGTMAVNASGQVTSSYSRFRYTGSGSDQYSDQNVALASSTTSEAGVSTTVTDVKHYQDEGTDEYAYDMFGSVSTDSSQIPSQFRIRTVSADGQSKSRLTDDTSVDTTSTSGPTITGHDEYHSTDDDDGGYNDTDVALFGYDPTFGAMADPAKGEFRNTDRSLHQDNDQNKFHVDGTKSMTITDGVSTATITGGMHDDGKESISDVIADQEQFGADLRDDGDHYTFDDTLSESDTGDDSLTITIVSHGGLGDGQSIDSTETITLTDDFNNSDNEDDPGTDDVGPDHFENEVDHLTAHLKSKDDIQIHDVVNGILTKTLAGGAVMTTEFHRDDTDHIVDTEDDELDDNHTYGANGVEVDRDVEDFDDKLHETDDFSAVDWSMTSVVIPITGGTLKLGSTWKLTDAGSSTEDDEETGEANAGNASAGGETDTAEVDSHDSGKLVYNDYFVLDTTDPTTGLKTKIVATDDDTDNFTNTFDEHFGNKSGSGGPQGSHATAAAALYGTAANGSTGYGDHETAKHTDSYVNKGHFEITMKGSPATGVTIDFEEQLDTEDDGTDSENDTLDSGNSGSTAVVDEFEAHDDIIETGGGHSYVTLDYSTDDGNGNSVSFHEEDKTNTTLDEEIHDDDVGEEDIGVAGGKVTGDTEHDTDIATVNVSDDGDVLKSSTITLSSVDAVTGLLTTYSVVDIYHESIAETQAEDETDSHTDGTSASDAISGTNDINVHDIVHHHQEETQTLVGTDANGVTYDLTETINRDEDEDDDITDDVSQSSSDVETDDEEVVETFDSNATVAVSGAVTTIDPSTGVVNILSLANSIRKTIHDVEDAHQIDTFASHVVTHGNPTLSESGTETEFWKILQTVTRKNSDGTVIGSPTTSSADLRDTITTSNGAITDLGLTSGSNNPGAQGAPNGQGSTPSLPDFGSNVQATDLGGGVTKLTAPDGSLIGCYIQSLDAVARDIGGQLYIKSSADVKSQLDTWNGVFVATAFKNGAVPFTIDPATGDWTIVLFDPGVAGKPTTKTIPNPNPHFQSNWIADFNAMMEARDRELNTRYALEYEPGPVEKYIANALGTTFVGNWSGAETNVLGIAGSIAFGLTGFDAYKDVLDISHDLYNWEWKWSHAGNLAMDSVGVLPGIGAIKNLKGAPDLAKAGSDAVGAAVGFVKQIGKKSDDVVDGVHDAAKNLDDVSKNLHSVAPNKITTPNAAARAKSQGEYINPRTNKVVKTTETLAADHIFPKAQIKELPGFNKLTPAQQSKVLNNLENFRGLPQSLNASKGSRLDWSKYRGEPLDPQYAKELADLQQVMKKELQAQIDAMFRGGR